MIKFNFFPFFLGWLLFSAPLAAESPDFYQALAPLKERGEAAQQATLSRVLEQVFVKLTGSRETVRNSSLGNYLGRAGKLVEQYEYRNQPVYPGGPGPLSLWARFSSEGVDELLNKAGVVPWKNRPLVLIWMALEEGENQTVVNPEETPEAAELLKIHAEQRALPIMFPLLDLSDRLALSTAQLRNGEHEAARRAAERYVPGAVLSGYLRHVPRQGWRGQWHLHANGNTEDWSLDNPDLPEILREAVNTLASRLAGEHGTAVVADSSEFTPVELLVSPIGGMDVYHRVRNYLASLDHVRNLQVKQVDPEQVRFQLEARGGEENLVRALALGRVLEPAGETSGTAPDHSDLLMDLFPELLRQERTSEPSIPLLHYRPR